ncbi:7985_t:CDS:1 [Paraglomus occultum]|uniref:7985_t:CDS:1 n=1 Tax=Paraglomus occultum TaxID=144539 RepID=A0A9N9DHE7_9GLOM|nr:7985_t:CDS:1 [Paraglomus occultum]
MSETSDLSLPSIISATPSIPLHPSTTRSITNFFNERALARVIVDFQESRYSSIQLVAEGDDIFIEFNGSRRQVIIGDSIIFGSKIEMRDNTRLKLEEEIRVLLEFLEVKQKKIQELLPLINNDSGTSPDTSPSSSGTATPTTTSSYSIVRNSQLPIQWKLGEKMQLLELARLAQAPTQSYITPVVSNVRQAAILYQRARNALRSRNLPMQDKYVAAADAHAASLFAESGSYSLEQQVHDLSFDIAKPMTWKSVSKRKAQFAKVNQVLGLCGRELPPNLLSVSLWLKPQGAARDALTYLIDSAKGAEIPDSSSVESTRRRRFQRI